MSENRMMSHAAGAPIVDNLPTMTAGPRGPALLQDIWLIEKLAHFDREACHHHRFAPRPVIRCPANYATRSMTTHEGMPGTTADAGGDSSYRRVATAAVSSKDQVTQQPTAARLRRAGWDRRPSHCRRCHAGHRNRPSRRMRFRGSSVMSNYIVQRHELTRRPITEAERGLHATKNIK
jgi:hypothetical protein